MHRPDPTLDQILADPIIRAVMMRDGVSETRLRDLMERVDRARSASPAADLVLEASALGSNAPALEEDAVVVGSA